MSQEEVCSENDGLYYPDAAYCNIEPKEGEAALVLSFDFNDVSGDLVPDISGYANDGFGEFFEVVEGKDGSAIKFSDYPGYIAIFPSRSLQLRDRMSLRMSFLAEVDPILQAQSLFGRDEQFHLTVSQFPELRWLSGGELHYLAATVPISYYTWNDLVLTFDSKLVKIYLNGWLAAEAEQDGLLDLNPYAWLLLGDNVGPPFPGVASLVGLIDDLKLYGRALSEEELCPEAGNCRTMVYPDQTDDGLVAFYDFEQGFGSTFKDRSGSANPGINLGDAVSPRLMAYYGMGVSAYTDGISGGIALGDASMLDLATGTSLSFWFLKDNEEALNTLVAFDGLFSLDLDLDDLVLRLAQSGEEHVLAEDLDLFVPHLVSLRIAAGQFLLLLDEQFSAALPFGAFEEPPNSLLRFGAEGFSGSVDQIKIYAKSLTETELCRLNGYDSFEAVSRRCYYGFDPLLIDSDFDGHPDLGDVFPDDSNEWTDSDLDGIGDNADAFPDDPSETTDSDGDGHGDNGDIFPNDPKNWQDRDGDGTGDLSDAFPLDPNEWADIDGNRLGDRANRPDPDLLIYHNFNRLSECTFANFLDNGYDARSCFVEVVPRGMDLRSVLFPTTCARITLASRPVLADDYTIDFWLKPFDVERGQLLLGFGDDLTIALRSGTIEIAMSGIVLVATDRVIVDNDWNHLIVTQDLADLVVFVNGKKEGAIFTAPTPITSTALPTMSSDCVEETQYAGLVDEFKIYSRGLNDSEVENAYLLGLEKLAGQAVMTYDHVYYVQAADGLSVTYDQSSDPLYGNGMIIPPDALRRDSTIVLSRTSVSPDGMQIGGPQLLIAAVGAELSQPATLTLPYRRDLLELQGYLPEDLLVFKQDTQSGALTYLTNTVVDTSADRLSFTTDSFSRFGAAVFSMAGSFAMHAWGTMSCPTLDYVDTECEHGGNDLLYLYRTGSHDFESHQAVNGNDYPFDLVGRAAFPYVSFDIHGWGNNPNICLPLGPDPVHSNFGNLDPAAPTYYDGFVTSYAPLTITGTAVREQIVREELGLDESGDQIYIDHPCRFEGEFFISRLRGLIVLDSPKNHTFSIRNRATERLYLSYHSLVAFDSAVLTITDRFGAEAYRQTLSTNEGSFYWNGKDQAGALVPTGTYTVSIAASYYGYEIFTTRDIVVDTYITIDDPTLSDTDGDGVADKYDAFPFDPTETKDTDRDGFGDNADNDDDGDRVKDDEDAFPGNPMEWADSDGDGIGDNTDQFFDDPDAWIPYGHPLVGIEPVDGKLPFVDTMYSPTGKIYAYGVGLSITSNPGIEDYSGVTEHETGPITEADKLMFEEEEIKKFGYILPDLPPQEPQVISASFKEKLDSYSPVSFIDVEVELKEPPHENFSHLLEKAMAEGEICTEADYKAKRQALLEDEANIIWNLQNPVVSYIEDIGGQVVSRCKAMYCLSAKLTTAQISSLSSREDIAKIELAEADSTADSGDKATTVNGFTGDDVLKAIQLDQFIANNWDGSNRNNGPNNDDDYQVAIIDSESFSSDNVGFMDYYGNPAEKTKWPQKISRIDGIYRCNFEGECTPVTSLSSGNDHGTQVTGILLGDLNDGQDSRFTGQSAAINRSGYAPEARGIFLLAGKPTAYDFILTNLNPIVTSRSASAGTDTDNCKGQTMAAKKINPLYGKRIFVINTPGNYPPTNLTNSCTIRDPASAMGNFTVGAVGNTEESKGSDDQPESNRKNLRVANLWAPRHSGTLGSPHGGLNVPKDVAFFETWKNDTTIHTGDYRSIIDIVPPGCRKNVFTNTGDYTSYEICGTSFAAPTTAAAVVDIVDHWKSIQTNKNFIDDPGILHAYLLLLGDRMSTYEGYMQSGFDHRWGAGRLKARPIDINNIDTPGGYWFLTTCIKHGAYFNMDIKSGQALSSDIDYIKAVMWWYDYRYQDTIQVANVDMTLVEIMADGSEKILRHSNDKYDNKERIFQPFVGGKKLRLKIWGQDVLGTSSLKTGCSQNDAIRVYVALIFEDDDRDDADQKPKWDKTAGIGVEPERKYFAWYPFDTDRLDYSGFGYSQAILGGNVTYDATETLWDSGEFGHSLHIQKIAGMGSFVAPDGRVLNGATNFTISFWAKINHDNINTKALFSMCSGNDSIALYSQGPDYRLGYPGGDISVHHLNYFNDVETNPRLSLIKNKWHKITLERYTINNNSVYTLYLNDVSSGDVLVIPGTSPLFMDVDDLSFGITKKCTAGGYDLNTQFEGYIDNIVITSDKHSF